MSPRSGTGVVTLPPRLRRWVFRPAAFALLWLVMTEGDLRAWYFAAPGIAVAAAVGEWLLPSRTPAGLRPAGVLRFLWFFVSQSVVGGADVARRALDPRLPIDPGMVDVSIEHLSESSTAGLELVVSVLPGTVAVRAEDGTLRVHAIDVTKPVRHKVTDAAERIAGVLGPQARPADAEEPEGDRG